LTMQLEVLTATLDAYSIRAAGCLTIKAGAYAGPVEHSRRSLDVRLDCLQTPNPSMAEVKALHAEIQDALLQLYNCHRHLLPALDGKELTFV
jgi:hypothetical protein